MLSATLTGTIALGAGLVYWRKKNTNRLGGQEHHRNLVLGFSENTLKLTKAMAMAAMSRGSRILWVVDTVSFGAGFVDIGDSIKSDERKTMAQVRLSDEPDSGFAVLQAQVQRSDVFSKNLAIDLDLTSQMQCSILERLLLDIGTNIITGKTKQMPNYVLMLNHYHLYRTPALDDMLMALAKDAHPYRIGIVLATDAIAGLSAYVNLCEHIHVLDGSWNDSLTETDRLLNPAILALEANQSIKKGQLRYLDNTTAHSGVFFDLPREPVFRL